MIVSDILLQTITYCIQNWYDQKQYKNALKNCDSILENNKDHAGKDSRVFLR